MHELVQRIGALSDENALEALNILSGDALGDTPDEDILGRLADATGADAERIRTALDQATPAQTAALCRVVLIVHASRHSAEDVERAVDETGKKAFLLELAVIGLLGLGVLHTVFTRGKKSERRVTEIDVAADGTMTVRIEEETLHFSVGESLSPFVSELIKPLTGG